MQIKIEQIAIAAIDPEEVINNHIKIGCNEWSHDIVEAQGFVFGKKAHNIAELHFNYQLGYELEILKYIDGPNWHERRNPAQEDMFLSHKGMHVTKEQMDSWKELMDKQQIGIAQEVWTISHSNPAIAGKRKYHYVVFDSISKFGYDLKLIERIMI